MKIKICWLTRIEDVGFANVLRPDYVGFVFAGGRRRVTLEQAGELGKALDSSINKVGVFVNAELSFMEELCKQGIIDVIQLHGEETPDTVKQLQEQVGYPVIKAVKIAGGQNVPEIVSDDGCQNPAMEEVDKWPCDYLLLDTLPGKPVNAVSLPAPEQVPAGGTGELFDHALIPPLHHPFFLAGGLNPSNVFQVLEALQARGIWPFAVDVSSGVEQNHVKSYELMQQFINEVNRFKKGSIQL